MGRWIEWRVEGDLTPAEVTELASIVNGPIRDALPDVARQISVERPISPGLTARLYHHYADRATAQYASDPEAILVDADDIHVKGSQERRRLSFSPAQGDYAGHTIGFQDYATIGVLAAASQVSGKIVLLGGDDFSPDYVGHVLARLDRAGAGLKPHRNFASNLEQISDDD